MEVGESAKELGPSFRWRMTAETEVAVPRGSTEGVLAEAHPKRAWDLIPVPLPTHPDEFCLISSLYTEHKENPT